MGSLSHYLQGFLHPPGGDRRISSTNSIIVPFGVGPGKFQEESNEITVIPTKMPLQAIPKSFPIREDFPN